MDTNQTPQDTFISSIDLLRDYLEENPDDILKWTEFLNLSHPTTMRNRLNPGLRNLFLEVLPNGELAAYPDTEIRVPQQANPTPLTSDIVRKITRNNLNTIRFREGFCGVCDTELGTFKLMTLPCGHSYHTDCLLAVDYELGLRCTIEGCHREPHDRIRAVFQEVRRTRTRGMNVVFNRLKKRTHFKKDCAALRRTATKISKSHSAIQKFISAERKNILELHGDKLNLIQHDMNQIPKKVRDSDCYKARVESIREGRAAMRLIYRKYRVGMRDLIDNIGMRFSWEVRWILERNRTHNYFSAWRAGIRMRPGAVRSWKPSETKKKPTINVDTESDTDSDSEA